MKNIFAMHYPSTYAPPVGVWWWDESSGAVRHHYLAGHADISQSLAGDLGDVASASEWRARLAQLRQRASSSSFSSSSFSSSSSSSSEDKVRTLTTSFWSPVDMLLTTISHWPLRW